MCPINSELYIHQDDKAALKALKEIPGFSSLMKEFMKIGYEKSWYIRNMSSNIRLNENQLPHIYNMLPPICEKLGINVPELYLELSTYPNAYTFGDTKPFIVITTGLLERFTDDEIKTTLAHECGHIACHHTLYQTLGHFVMYGGLSILQNVPGINLITVSFNVAYCYWLRCAEYSCDRAAAICDGGPEGITSVMLRFSGTNKDIDSLINKEEYLKQANEYKQYVSDSKWNKTLEFLAFSTASHPMNVLRTSAIIEWCKSSDFNKILLNGESNQIELNVCPQCGNQINKGQKFCGVCGYKLINE